MVQACCHGYRFQQVLNYLDCFSRTSVVAIKGSGVIIPSGDGTPTKCSWSQYREVNSAPMSHNSDGLTIVSLRPVHTAVYSSDCLQLPVKSAVSFNCEHTAAGKSHQTLECDSQPPV